MFRLKFNHSKTIDIQYLSVSGQQLILDQSIFKGFFSANIVAILNCFFWSLLSLSFSKVFPWFSVLIGFFVGFAIQRFGRGLDWRFPLMAGTLAWVYAYFGNLIISILETAIYIDADFFEVLIGISTDTIKNFFRFTLSPIDHIYALVSAALAAFFSNRRLNRQEFFSLRTIEFG
mgnify:CR=1 FL=1